MSEGRILLAFVAGTCAGVGGALAFASDTPWSVVPWILWLPMLAAALASGSQQ